MEQYITRGRFEPGFANNKYPRMAYLYKINGESSDTVRVVHSHKDIVEVILVTNGSGTYIVSGKQYEVEAGTLIILNAGVVHEECFGSENMLSTFCLGIENLQLNNMQAGKLISDKKTPVIEAGETSGAVLKLMELILWQQSKQMPRRNETCHYLMLSLISVIAHSFDDVKYVDRKEWKNEALVTGICNYIDENFSGEISLQDISDMFHISKYHLCHVFKEYMDCSIMQYVLRRRIGEAQSLLIETDYSVSYIGSLTGFSSPSYFNAQFTRIVGMTPLKYRNTRSTKRGENQ